MTNLKSIVSEIKSCMPPETLFSHYSTCLYTRNMGSNTTILAPEYFEYCVEWYNAECGIFDSADKAEALAESWIYVRQPNYS